MKFKKLYVWAASTKFIAGIFLLAHIVYFMIFNFLLGIYTLSFTLIFQLLAISAIIALFQSFYLMRDFDMEKGFMQKKTIIWILISIFFVIAAIIIFKWYIIYPLVYMLSYLSIVTINFVFLLLNMIYERQIDSDILNNDLNEYKKKRVD
jgi:hypothetical protein